MHFFVQQQDGRGTMAEEDIPLASLLPDAVKAYRNMVGSGATVSASDAMIFVGIAEDLARSRSAQEGFNRMSNRFNQENGKARFQQRHVLKELHNT